MRELNIVCIPFHDIKLAQEEGFRTRDSHLYKYFSTHPSVKLTVIFNRPTLFLEMLLGKKKLKTAGNLVYTKNGIYITQITKKLYAVDILDFSIVEPIVNGKGFIPDLYERNVARFIRALNYLGVEDYISYESSPLTVPLCSKLNSSYRIFDGVDNLCKHATYQKFKKHILSLYNKALSNYPAVFFNSRDSISYFNAEKKLNVEFLSNGVDFEIFRAASKTPPSIEALKRPLVIYAGKMQEMLDVDLVKDCATHNSNATFLLLGKVLDPDVKKYLDGISNVIFGGDIKYDDLPSYIRSADVCFIPYRVEKQHGGDPIKFYEYMAANKKILSTPIGEIEKYHNGESIIICGREDFAFQLKKLLNSKIEISNELPLEMTWNYKSDYMLQKVLKE